MVISVKKDSSYFTEAITPDSPSNWIHNERRAIFQTGAPGHGIIKYLQTNSSISDSIPIKRIDSAYHLALAKAGIGISFTVIKTELEKNEYTDPRRIYTTKVPIGLLGKPAYQAILNEPGAYLFKKIISQIIFSILLVALTLVSFVFLYRNLLRQKRLTESKNEFISNITHELKTPISTVGVAIEAIRNFNVLQNTEKTGEYLDIANQELKRLALLVDKVLRLSMFESQELDLDREPINMESVANEVMQSMRIQFEKQGAIVEFEKKGTDFTVMGDHLHLVSVIYNLLDNALKYTSGAPRISICLEEQKGSVLLRVTDNGLGIPREYHSRVFEKFFRVPYGDRHNVKGYGLGLSYVAHIIEKHKGKISLESEPGKFTRFNIEIPKQA